MGGDLMGNATQMVGANHHTHRRWAMGCPTGKSLSSIVDDLDHTQYGEGLGHRPSIILLIKEESMADGNSLVNRSAAHS